MMGSERIFCSVFKSSRKEGMYVYVDRAVGCEELPDVLKAVFGEPRLVMDMVLTPTKKLARVHAREVLEKIAEQGFYLQMPPADVLEQIPGAIAMPNDSLHG